MSILAGTHNRTARTSPEMIGNGVPTTTLVDTSIPIAPDQSRAAVRSNRAALLSAVGKDEKSHRPNPDGAGLLTGVGSARGSLDRIAPRDDDLLFPAADGVHDTQLWVSAGIPSGEARPSTSAVAQPGTTLVLDINQLSDNRGSFPYSSMALGNGTAVFSAKDGTHGRELWMTDGTAAGTALVADINPGLGESFPGWFAQVGNAKVVFSADDGTHGQELWVTDGTAVGTVLVADICPGLNGSNSFYLTPLGNGKVVFSADDGTHGRELWVTDGTAVGTALIADIASGSSYPRDLSALGVEPQQVVLG